MIPSSPIIRRVFLIHVIVVFSQLWHQCSHCGAAIPSLSPWPAIPRSGEKQQSVSSVYAIKKKLFSSKIQCNLRRYIFKSSSSTYILLIIRVTFVVLEEAKNKIRAKLVNSLSLSLSHGSWQGWRYVWAHSFCGSAYVKLPDFIFLPH